VWSGSMVGGLGFRAVNIVYKMMFHAKWSIPNHGIRLYVDSAHTQSSNTELDERTADGRDGFSVMPYKMY
jgi:hypothetical protein